MPTFYLEVTAKRGGHRHQASLPEGISWPAMKEIAEDRVINGHYKAAILSERTSGIPMELWSITQEEWQRRQQAAERKIQFYRRVLDSQREDIERFAAREERSKQSFRDIVEGRG